ncbi:YcnI family copper-binding membrane protein [Virgibacillus alimentarius]|uniref:Uncharacterized protein YcnI n=1 Tax=Virgibacillus alimentarius TaxID=698769 RepID=A0ABS4S9C3_9BACI|nr:YcnI family protein [Virgibacillus alimentarius]MBP2258100.1 uncharacterized protein YcnI [Virgibacillus alimentarius]
MKKWIVLMVAVVLLFVAAPIAEAHVTVHPSESSTNAYEKYSVRIPVEKDANTTKVELEVPEGIHVVSVLPNPDWKYKFLKNDNDTITSVTWTAKDGGIGPNEFAEFSFIGANPGKPGEFSWKAFQTYDDDSVVEWTGEPESEEPASVTEVVEGDETAHHDDNPIAESGHAAQNESDNSGENGNTDWLPLVLAGAALLLSIISLFRKRA